MNRNKADARLLSLMHKRFVERREQLQLDRVGSVHVDESERNVRSLVMDEDIINVDNIETKSNDTGTKLAAGCLSTMSDGMPVFLKFIHVYNKGTSELNACLDATLLHNQQRLPGVLACVDAFIVDVIGPNSHSLDIQWYCIVMELGERLAPGEVNGRTLHAVIASHALLLAYTYAAYMGRSIGDPSCPNTMFKTVRGKEKSVTYVIDGNAIRVPLTPVGNQKLVVIDHGNSFTARDMNGNSFDDLDGAGQAERILGCIEYALMAVACLSGVSYDNTDFKVMNVLRTAEKSLRVGPHVDIPVPARSPVSLSNVEAHALLSVAIRTRLFPTDLLRLVQDGDGGGGSVSAQSIMDIGNGLEKAWDLTDKEYADAVDQLQPFKQKAMRVIEEHRAMQKAAAKLGAPPPIFAHRRVLMQMLLELAQIAGYDGGNDSNVVARKLLSQRRASASGVRAGDLGVPRHPLKVNPYLHHSEIENN